MRRILLPFGLLLCSAAAWAQQGPYATRWTRTFPQPAITIPLGSWNALESKPTHLSPHPAGGYVVTSIAGPAGNLYRLHVDAQGNLLATKNTVARTQSFKDDAKFAHDAQGNVVLADQYGMVKLNASGDTVWTRRFPAHTHYGFATEVAVGPDGNYVVAYQQYSAASGSNPVFLDLQITKVAAATGLALWNTSLTTLLANTFTSYTNSGFGACPVLARRSSGYFVSVYGNTATGLANKLVSINEDGTGATLRGTTLYRGRGYGIKAAPLYCRDGTTVFPVGQRLDDQGNVVATGPITSNGEAIVALAEDLQSNLVYTGNRVTATAPGLGGLYTVKIGRAESSLQNLDSQYLTGNGPGDASDFADYNLLVTALGEYIAAAPSDNYANITIVSLAGSAPLAARRAAERGQLAVAPNPSQGATAVSISLPANAVGELRLYDLLGLQYGPARFVRGTTATLPLPRLAAGVYVVRFTGTDGQTWAERLTVQ